MPLPIIPLDADPGAPFPPVAHALREPDGLLAVGGDLHPQRLLNAYRRGIFPWFSDGQPPLWWSPDPRAVFDTDRVHLSRRFRRTLARSDWQVRFDTRFEAVIRTCAQIPRQDPNGRLVVSTWITRDMLAAYVQLHRLGHAHSVEVVDGTRLVGGLYGVALGQMFFAESMFSTGSGGSKVALAALAWLLRGWHWPLIDTQMTSPHLRSLGARELPRAAFIAHLDHACTAPGRVGNWAALAPSLAACDLARSAVASD